jgi:phosphomannomutase
MSALVPENAYCSTPEIKVPVSDSTKFHIIGDIGFAAKEHNPITIDGVKIYADDGWLLIRASNTTPNLIVRCESMSIEGLEVHKEHVSSLLNGVLARYGHDEFLF